MTQTPVITIDGPSGSGKGTVSRHVAQKLGWQHLDSGALYRIIAYAAGQIGVSATQADVAAALVPTLNIEFVADDGEGRVWLNGNDVTAHIRTEQCGNAASKFAKLPPVREALVTLQRGFQTGRGLVADGRDMGTVIFPQAEVKIFLTASAEERAQRRYKQLKKKGLSVNLDDLLRDLRERDRRDGQRAVSPLVPALDAHQLDTTTMSIDEAVAQVLIFWENTATS